MAKQNYSIRKRERFQAENSPIFLPVDLISGQLLHILTPYARGDVVVSGGAANGTSTGPNPGNLVAQLFEVDAITKGKYSGGTIKRLTPQTIASRRIFDKGFLQPDISLGAAGISGAAGTYTLNSASALRFALPRMRNPIETALKLDEFTQVMLKITNGSRNNQFSGNDRTFDYASLFWETMDYREIPGNGLVPPVTLYDLDRVLQITGANQRRVVDGELPKTEAYLDALWMAITANKALADTIINRVTLFDGTEQFYDQYEDEIKGEQQESVTDLVQSMTGLYYTPIVRDAGQGMLMGGAVANLNAIVDQSNPSAGNDSILLSTRSIAAARA